MMHLLAIAALSIELQSINWYIQRWALTNRGRLKKTQNNGSNYVYGVMNANVDCKGGKAISSAKSTFYMYIHIVKISQY